MRYTRTAITQLSKWYRNILIKCAIFNAAVFIGAVGISDNASATEVSVADWSALKSAIDNAAGDTTITLTNNITASNVPTRAIAKGDSNIILDLNNNTIDVQIANTQKLGEYTVIDSNANETGFFHFTVKDGTIQNAVESALLFDAVKVSDSSGTVSNVRFLNNTADGTNHSGYAQGGALKIFSITDVTISGSEFIGNTVIDAGVESYGGAVESYANNLLVENTKFIGNGILDYGTDSAETTTQDGGAMLISSKDSTFDNVTFTSNKSTNSAGAIYYLLTGDDLTSTIKNSTFEGNETVNKGGAISTAVFLDGSHKITQLNIENTDFTSNKATGSDSKGGAIYAFSGVDDLTLVDSSFKNNSAKEGGAIYNDSLAATTIHAKTKDVVFENNNSTGAVGGSGSGIYLNGTLNALASDNRTLTINDTIKFANANSMLNVNTDFTNNYSGTVVLDKALDGGYGINLGSDSATGNVGTLKLGQEAANQTLNFFGAYGGTLDLQNNSIGDNLTITTLGGNAGTKLNLDYDASTGIIDKLTVNAVENGLARLDLNSILISKDGDVASTVYLDGAAKDEVTLISNAIKTVTSGGYTYTFTPNGQGVLQVTREVGGITLADMLQDELNGSTFTLTSSYTVPSDLPQLVGTNREFTIGEVDGNTFTMTGDSKKGFTIANGQILNLQNIRNNADINSATAGISGFTDLLDNSGTTNIQNSYISDNSSLNNKGTLNVKDSIFDNNSVTNSGTMNLNASQDKKIVFNNTSIQNSGTINANAEVNSSVEFNSALTMTDAGKVAINSNGETGSVLFNSSVTGGSIDNKAGTTEFNATSDLANLYLNGGTVKVGQNGTLSTDNLYSNSGILDLQNGKVGDIVTVDNLKAVENGAAGALLNVDFDASTGVMDKLTVNNAEAGSSVLLNSILISTDGSANSATYLDGAGAQNVSVTSSPVVSAMTSQGWVYTFTPDSSTNGLLIVTRENKQGTLEDAIKNSAISSWSLVNDYALGSSNTMVLSGADRNFTIGQSDGNTYVLNGNGSSGIQVGDGQTLNIQNIKNNNDIANATDGISGFSKFITGTQGSKVNVVDTYFTQNTGNVISNSGELTVSGSKFANNNNASSSNGVISNLGTLSIENTDFENNTNADNGGAIYNSFDATIDKISGKFISNKATASDGGAIYNYSTITNIDSAEFDANSADEGGAIYNSGSIDSIGATFSNNNSNYQYGGGGAIYNSQSINKIAADFEGNTAAGKGGAIYNASSASIGEISGKFASNTATSGNGGAIYNDNTIGSISGTFSKNNSNYKYGGGGAIYNNESITEIAADFEGNTAAGKGGAIYNVASVGNINGEFTGNIATNDGGAIYNNDTITTIESAVFSGNSGESGGAIYNNDTIATISSAEFNGNEAEVGGAIYNKGTIDSINASFSNNKSTTGFSFYGGGAIYNEGVIKALTGDFIGNTTTGSGGAIFNEGVIKALTGDFIGNTTTGSGGAIYNNGTINILSTADRGVEFSNNTAKGIANSIYNSYNKTLNFNADSANNIVVNDEIINQSGAIININMTGTGDSGNTIATNAPTNGVVEFNGNYSGAGTVNLYDGTLKLGSGNKTFSTFGANGGTLDMQNNTAGDVLTISTLQGNGNVNLKLDYDASNGTMDSLAVNGYTGSNVGLLLTSVNVTSDGESTKGTYLTGRSKNSVNVITDAITAVTSGGYKYTFTPDATKGVLIVTREDSGALIEQGLQAAIADASVDSFSVNNNYTAVSSLGTLAGDNRNFTIYGNTNDIIASGSVEGIGINEGQTLTIDKVGDINDSNSKGFSGFKAQNGGAINNSGTTNITNSTFSGNSAVGDGGAIYNNYILTITDSSFSENTANSGGAIENWGILTIADSIFSENTAKEGLGSAIANYSQLTITDSSFSENTANSGGAIANYDIANIIAENKDVSFKNNNAVSGAGGAITNTKFWYDVEAVVNINAKNGNKITFAEATGTANNDIYNTATLNLNEGNIEILSAITDAVTQRGTTNIGTTTTTATVVANAITQKALNINNGSSLAINADGLKIADTINNLGSIALGDGTLTSAISGTNGTTVINGNVTLANNLKNQNIEITNGSLIANSTTDYIGSTNNLTIKNNGILDLSSSDKTINTVEVNNFTIDNLATNASGIKFDVNFDRANVSSDKVSVAGTATGNLNIQSVNVKGDLEGDIDTTTKTFNLVEGSNLSGLNLISDSIRTVTGQYAYDFTAGANDGELIVTKTNGMTLQEAIGQKGVDYNVTSYSLSKDYTADTSLGNLEGDNRNFTIYGNTNDIIASGSVEGISINEGQTLTIDKVGDINDSTSKGFSGFSAEYAGAIFNWSDGTLNISDSVFSDNSHSLYSAVVYNIGEANITNSIFRDNGVAIRNSALINSFNPEAPFVEYLGVANITDTDFINNESDYGAIINAGTMSIVAQDKDVLFSGNNNRTTAGGAIYNSNENLPLAGLGVLNLNAKNGHKITFAAATDSANNDIYNDATLNLNEGNIEILSAITDATTPKGTTNIGTADTTATVVANAITQKALNINNGSSLAINAGNLKITDTISNSGTITLGDGTLTSAINGTNGTTVINGNVVANSAIAQAITVNTDKSLTTSADNIGGAIANSGTVNLNSGILAQTITGGNINIANSQTVTSDLSKLAGNFENQGTLNLQGELSKDIAGDGTTVLQNNITLADNRTIAGTLDINNQTVDMGNEPAAYNTLTVGNLTGNGNLQIDVDLNNGSSDKISIADGTSNNGTLNLNVINVQNELATSDSPYNDYINYITGTTDGLTLNINGSEDGQIVVVTTEQKYTFTKGNEGSLNVLAQNYTGGLSDYITGEITANNFSINKDITLNDNENIGLTQGDDTTKNVFVNNGSTLTGFDGTNKYNNGITVADGYTVNLTGSEKASMENFITALEVNNGGSLNVTDMNFSNNTTDIANNGTLNLAGNNTLASGIEGNGATNISGTTTNNGTITQNTVSIANTATLNTNASSLIASAGVVNSGTLELTGGVVQSNITGNGTLSILDNITNDKTITQVINIANNKTLTNNGTLNTSVQLTANQTIDGNGTLNLTGTSINEGSITQGVVNVADTAELTTAADKITANINNAGNLELTGGINSNTISGTGTTEIAGIVENTGTISQAIKIDSGSLTTLASGLGGTVTNAIDGGLVLNGGTLTQAINGDGSTSIAGDVISNALISQAIDINSGSLTTSANNLGNAVTNMVDGGLVLNGGTLTQAVSGNGSTIIAGDVLWGTNAKMGNTTIAQNGSLDIGTNEVTLGDTTINGTLKMTITDMAKDSSDYTGGKLIVDNLDLGESSKLSMTVASGLITERDASTGGLDLITVNGASSGKFAEMLSNNRYAVSMDDNGKFKITYTASPTDIVNEGGGNINNAQAAEAWDKVPTTGNAATDDMQAHLNELSQHDSNGYVKALNNLAPTDSRAVARTTVDVNNLIGHQIERRQDMQGMNSGDTFQNVGAWMEGLYNYSKQDSSSTHAGFTGKTAGFALGMDGKVNEDTMVGFGYANNQTDIDTLDRDIDVDGHTLFVYGKYQPEKWYVRGMAHYGFASYDEKSDVNGKYNSADYDVQNIGLSAYAGYDLPNGITPEAGLRFTHISQDDYTDYVGQHISVDDNDILTLVAGAKYSKTFTGEDGIHWTPKARAAVTYDVIKDDNNANVDIAGINYDVTGEKINRLEFEVGLGIEADVNNWNFSVGYDAGIREDYISHTGMFRARYNF